MLTIRVDVNITLAVCNAAMKVRKTAVEEIRPIIVEAMSYRVGHHRTSDDSSAYRSKEEIEHWSQTDGPNTRLRLYMTNNRNCRADGLEAKQLKVARSSALKVFAAAEKRRKPSPSLLFTDVYQEVPTY